MRKLDSSNAASSSLSPSSDMDLSLDSLRANGNPVALSAEENDRLLIECFLTGSHASLGFARLLLELHETRRYIALGFPSTTHYAEMRFRIARTQVMEHVRVARALRELPVLTKALEDGELSWSLLAEITRVATKDSEDEWLAFATKHGFHRTRAEVRSAREENRSRPRRGEYGLPRLFQRFALSLAPEEMALVETVLSDVAAAAGKRLGAATHEPIEAAAGGGGDAEEDWTGDLPTVDPKTAFLLLCRVFHETEGGVEGFLASRTPRKDGPYAVTFKQCPTCHASAVSTNEGEVSVPPEVVDRVVGSAEIERFDDHGAMEAEPTTTDETPRIVPPSERDRPNSSAFSRKVKRRDGNRCLNCGKRACLQAHHIIHRVHGGRTEPANELTLCAVCHALIHEGRLGLEGDVFGGFRFFPPHECMGKSIKEIGEKLLLSKISGASMSGIPDSASGNPDSGPGDGGSGFDVEHLASGLVNIGYREKDAIQAISRAIGRLASDSSRKSPITEQEIFKEAVRRGGRR